MTGPSMYAQCCMPLKSEPETSRMPLQQKTITYYNVNLIIANADII